MEQMDWAVSDLSRVDPDPLFEEVAMRALEQAMAGRASYTDVRVLARRDQEIAMANGRLEAVRDEESVGFGVRVLVDGTWGFAASADLSPPSVEATAAHAVQLARTSAAFVGSGTLQLSKAARGSAGRVGVRGACEEDPFAVSLEQKFALLQSCIQQMRGEAAVQQATAHLHCRRERKLLVTSEGSGIYQEWTECGAGLLAIAGQGGERQRRTFPNLFAWHAERGGFECVRALDLQAAAAQIAAEAVELLGAPPCPEGDATLILLPSMLAIQLHESLGHAAELDRALGLEVAGAGGTYLTPDQIGAQIAAPCVTVVADATLPRGPGSFLYDDEGVVGQRFPLIQEGRFVGYLSTRETATRLGLASTGCARAEGWQRPPLLRMTNINMQPGPWQFEELLADIDHGFILDTCRSWSIDERRLRFQFGAELAREVRHGKPGRLYRNPVYTGRSPDFWRACDMVGREVQAFGVSRCFKGQPGQLVRVTHQVPAARFRNVRLTSSGGR